MNERNVPRVRRRARPSRGANERAGRARDPALRARGARAGSQTSVAPDGSARSGAGVERAGAARCLSEAGRHCREAAATTTAPATGAPCRGGMVLSLVELCIRKLRD